VNDYHLNIKKIRRFLPEDIVSDMTDRPYSIKEKEQILSKCDVRSRAGGLSYDFNRYAHRWIEGIAFWRHQED
jgi:hypothetical protein